MISPRSLLARSGWSEGDVWTVSLGLVLALSLAITTVPAALQPRQPQALAAPAPTPTPEPTPAVPLVVLPPPSPAAELPPLALPDPVAFPDQGEPAPPSSPSSPSEPDPTSSPSAPPATRPAVAVGQLLPFAVLGVDGAAGGLTTGPDGTVHAASDAPGEAGGAAALVTWDATGRVRGRTTTPDQPTSRVRGLTALATTASGEVLAADAATSRLLRYTPSTRRWAVVATVPDVGLCVVPGAPCQPGLRDTAPLLRGLAVATDGTVYVADAGQGTIWRLPEGGATLSTWFAASDLLGEQALAGLDVDASGAVLLTVTRIPGLTADGSGTLDRIARAPDGAAGARSTVTGFAPGDDVVDVALGSAGVYVALRGTSAVVTLEVDGTERLRVTGPILTNPTALSLSDGRVLVASGGSRAAVLQVGVADRLS